MEPEEACTIAMSTSKTHKQPTTKVKKLVLKILHSLQYQRVLLLITGIFFVLFSIYSILRAEIWFKLHGDYGYDLTIFLESLETTLKGQGFFFNHLEWEEFGAISHFGTHNSPILFLLLLLYAVYPKVYTLLVIQAFAISFAAIILFKLASEVLNSKRKAFIISISYLMNPITHGLVRYEFHPAVLGVPFMLLFAYFMEKNNIKSSIISAILLLSVKEDAGLFLIAYAFFEILRKYKLNIRYWINEKKAVSFALLGVIWISVSVFIIIPHFNMLGVYPYFTVVYFTKSPYSRKIIFLTATAKLIIMFISMAFVHLRKIEYFIPICFLWAENALSTRIFQAVIGYQYDYMILPMSFIILVYATRELSEFELKLIGISSFVSLVLFSPIIGIGILDLYPLIGRDKLWMLIKIWNVLT